MAVKLTKTVERYEVDTESEAENLINDARKEYDVTKYSSTYKYKKSEQREYWIVQLEKNFVEAEFE